MRRRWKILIVVLSIVVLAATWRLVQEAGYRRTLAQYQRDLRPGMTRTAVDNYLKSHQGKQDVVGGGNTWSYLIRIGTMPIPFDIGCVTSKVYIALDFDSPGRQEIEPPPGSPSDQLKDIRITKVVECL